ncbi:MAG: HAMP domain-containing histidine kinase [Acidobacteria bacterium]|nr:HAMP domain-containing histidine kinase [Acidobacteriota bacterium]
MVPVNVARLIDGVMLLYGKKLRSQKIQIDRRYEWDGEVPAFPAELRQVFTNLIVNAVDAMPQGGHLCIHVRASREPAGQRRQGVLISLRDTGSGIPPETRKRIFEPFFTTKGEKGSGVGLWVSRGVVQRHSGRIWVHSDTRPGRSYTCFSVFLPGNPGQNQQKGRSIPSQTPAPKPSQPRPEAA